MFYQVNYEVAHFISITFSYFFNKGAICWNENKKGKFITAAAIQTATVSFDGSCLDGIGLLPIIYIGGKKGMANKSPMTTWADTEPEVFTENDMLNLIHFLVDKK